MYDYSVKRVKKVYENDSDSMLLRESASTVIPSGEKEPMVRTQIYLRQSEYNFCQAEAKRRDEPMAAVIRSYIDEKMEVPEHAWTNNPMLEPTPDDPDHKGHEDAGINHDHYVYGSPKKWMKVDGEWVEVPMPNDGGEEDHGVSAHVIPVEEKSSR